MRIVRLHEPQRKIIIVARKKPVWKYENVKICYLLTPTSSTLNIHRSANLNPVLRH